MFTPVKDTLPRMIGVFEAKEDILSKTSGNVSFAIIDFLKKFLNIHHIY